MITMNQENRQTGYEMLYLTACVLNNRKPEPDRIGREHFDPLYQMSQYHGLQAIVWEALNWAGLLGKMEDSLSQKWRQEKEKSVRNELLMNAERRQISDFLEENGIWHCPLKGILLKDLYPSPGMRQMADNDILYDRAGQEKLIAFMEGRGYRNYQIGKGVHDIFMRPPVYNFEMHRELFEYTEPVLQGYYKEVRKRLLRDSGLTYGYHFSDEDFYVYLVVHAYKHYELGGVGIRFLLDQYVYLRAMREKLDFGYIENQLDLLGIGQFEQRSQRLAFKLLSEPVSIFCMELDEPLKDQLGEMLVSGVYGTPKICMEKRMERFWEVNPAAAGQKLKYLWSRCFPPMEYYQSNFPGLYRYRLLIPLLFLYRILKALVYKHRSVIEEIRILYKRGCGKM